MLQERTPKVSVVIPTYNSADFITCALDSIDAQEYPDVEIIVVDDGSTDDTKGIVERYGHNIRLVSQANAGPAVARNRGLREASGKYVAMLDADDWFLPTKFHKQVALLEDNTQLGAVHSGWMLADASGREFGTVEPWHVSPKLNVKTWLAYQPVRLGSLLFRREWLTKVGGFDKEMRQSEDTELLLRLA
ncbi:MAG TPA: glycosyltransferase, partial [Pirellulaceae bacterium]|nr:glycosyltransferase [Pirellulaceae bacterium]